MPGGGLHGIGWQPFQGGAVFLRACLIQLHSRSGADRPGLTRASTNPICPVNEHTALTSDRSACTRTPRFMRQVLRACAFRRFRPPLSSDSHHVSCLDLQSFDEIRRNAHRIPNRTTARVLKQNREHQTSMGSVSQFIQSRPAPRRPPVLLPNLATWVAGDRR